MLRLPPSIQAVAGQLKLQPGATAKQLREALHMPRRTVYHALRRLAELGCLQHRRSLRDARQTYYWLVQGG